MKQMMLFVATLLALLMPLMAQKKIDDGMIYDQVRMRLANDPDIKGGNLTVEVKDGVVTVTGRVDKPHAQGKVDRVVKKVKGVTKVNNQVKVEP